MPSLTDQWGKGTVNLIDEHKTKRGRHIFRSFMRESRKNAGPILDADVGQHCCCPLIYDRIRNIAVKARMSAMGAKADARFHSQILFCVIGPSIGYKPSACFHRYPKDALHCCWQ